MATRVALNPSKRRRKKPEAKVAPALSSLDIAKQMLLPASFVSTDDLKAAAIKRYGSSNELNKSKVLAGSKPSLAGGSLRGSRENLNAPTEQTTSKSAPTKLPSLPVYSKCCYVCQPTIAPRSPIRSASRSTENLSRSQVLSFPTLERQGTAGMSANFRSSFNEMCDNGIRYTHSGRPANIRYRDTGELPTLEQIQRINNDRRKGLKISNAVNVEKVNGVKIPVAPAFKRANRHEVRRIVGRLSKPTTASSGVMDEKSIRKLEKVESEKTKEDLLSPRRGRSFIASRERSFVNSREHSLDSRDQLQRERDFKHLQKDTLMSRIRYEVTRLFAPDPYGVKEHKWPW